MEEEILEVGWKIEQENEKEQWLLLLHLGGGSIKGGVANGLF
jgi:hypothetical protein